MEIVSIASYLVSPGKNQENSPACKGAMVTLEGKLYGMLQTLYNRSDGECDIPIRFNNAADGTQVNEVKNEVVNFIQNPNFENGLLLANRLRDCTTGVSGLGLLFIILGRENENNKIVISRFPADVGILAEEQEGEELHVEYMERIFMKNATKYKAALYRGTSFEEHFWNGFVSDKQLNNQLAEYWIMSFLQSNLLTTSLAGTKRMANALIKATRQAESFDIKNELIGIGMIVEGLNGRRYSVNQILDRYNISEVARDMVRNNLPRVDLADDIFEFSVEEFRKHFVYKSVELDNGGIMIAPSENFDITFTAEEINPEDHEYRYTTQGRVVEQKIRKRK